MENKWFHCPRCGHRMFFLKEGNFTMEIKCTSCKQIITLNTTEAENDAHTTCNARYGSDAYERYYKFG